MDISENTTVFKTEAEKRLDRFLIDRFPRYSRTYFQFLIEEGCVLKNSQKAKKSEKLKEGDEIEILFRLTPEITLEPENIPLDVLFEDEHILAVNKPSGLVVHPAPGNWSHTFVNALLYHCQKKALSASKNLPENLRPGIVHRLDKETSGVLLSAKTETAQRFLIGLFAKRAVQKEYLAVVFGRAEAQTELTAPIGRDPHCRKLMRIDPLGKSAETHFICLAQDDKLSLVSAKPRSGRTHQIRVHLKHLKTPILGDAGYGFKKANQAYGALRPLLHAYKIKFCHPVSKKTIELTAPIPADFQFFIDRLKAQKLFQTPLPERV
ncbi:MAG: RluA family pseudouridine synthase [Parachlamydiales bacterium]|jgi:23S rRNA pseudouridine1911/1915/1917 synthase